MAKKSRADLAINTGASIATILGFLLSLSPLLLPAQLNDFTGRILGPVEVSGPIRAEFVAGQKWLFIATWLILSFSIGAAGAVLWNRIESLKARDIAAGREPRSWPILFVPLLATPCVLLGIFLPKAIFQPTNLTELTRQFGLGAWALRSLLGGIVLGLCILLVTALVSFALYRLRILARSLRGKKYLRIIENS